MWRLWIRPCLEIELPPEDVLMPRLEFDSTSLACRYIVERELYS